MTGRRALLLALPAALAAPLLAASKEAERLDACREVVRELARGREGIPRELLDKAECVAVIPGVLKAALGFGGRYGRGAVSCRSEGGLGPWGAPLMITLRGGSVGLQIGGEATDFVFLIMNPKGIDSLLKSKFTLGADASVAAGPIGRSAEAATDLRMRAEILSYSRSRGVFAGLSLEGAVVSQDQKATQALYGERVDPRDLLVRGRYAVPPEARGLVRTLQELSPRGDPGW